MKKKSKTHYEYCNYTYYKQQNISILKIKTWFNDHKINHQYNESKQILPFFVKPNALYFFNTLTTMPLKTSQNFLTSL